MHTYSGCYKVFVPPFTVDGVHRVSGVKLQEQCETLQQLQHFDVLYLPQQLQAEWKEKQQQQQQQQQSSAHDTRAINGNYHFAHAHQPSFHALRAADNVLHWNVNYRASPGDASRSSSDTDASSVSSSSSSSSRVPSLLLTMCSAPLPSSTSSAHYTGRLSESTRVDRANNHHLYAPHDSVNRRVAYGATQNPSFIISLPSSSAHPYLFNNSAAFAQLQRAEAQAAHNSAQAKRQRAIQQQLKSVTTRRRFPRPPQAAHTARITLPSNAIHASTQPVSTTLYDSKILHEPMPNNDNNQTITQRSYLSQYYMNTSNPHNPTSTSSSPSSHFKQHMQRARAKWRTEGRIFTDEQDASREYLPYQIVYS